jgi:ABC-type dipeptide/oligopeptide/nickel transport system permease subunit
MRSLAKLDVKDYLIASFFNTIISPVVMYACVSFLGLLSKQLRSELSSVIESAREFSSENMCWTIMMHIMRILL